MRLFNLIAILLLSYSLSSCGFLDNDLKSYFKCSYVANHLGMSEAEQEINFNLQQYIIQNKITGNNEKARLILQEVQDELDLHSLSRQGKLITLLKVYNSNTCQNFHKQGEATLDMY